MHWLTANIRWIMLVSGALTCTMLYPVINPRAAVRSTFVAPNDPLTLMIVAALMGAVGIAACWIPAARAARIDPGVALRAQ